MRPTSLPCLAEPPAQLPRGIWDRPVVYVTLGTFSNTNRSLFRLLIDAVCSAPVNVVVATGRNVDPADLGELPPQAHARQFIPQEQLLPHCVAVVHHAGAGTAFGALAHGLPSVAVPQSADNFTIAARLRAAGVAEVLLPDEVTVGAVASALAAVVNDGPHRLAAGRLAAEIAAMPAPEHVAAALRDTLGPRREP